MHKTMNKKASRIGRYAISSHGSEKVKAFVPPELPPVPPIDLSGLIAELSRANLALGALDGIAHTLPDLGIFLYGYIRKEALLSSEIEGTQSTLTDLLLYEAKERPGVPIEDVKEVSNYIAALQYGLKRLAGGFPLCLRFIREVHGKLLKSGRGASKQPGEFRRTQNWIGGTRPGNAHFVPPPPLEMKSCLNALEYYMQSESDLPVLIKCGLIHVQFESIHPFLDGNGRVGRLLMLFYLIEKGILSEPLMYLSLHLKKHRKTYYEKLQDVRTKGAWEEWLLFFLEGITATAKEVARTSMRLEKLFRADLQKIEKLPAKQQKSVTRVFNFLQKQMISSVPYASKKLNMTQLTVRRSLKNLELNGVVKEISNKKRGRIYVYDKAFLILNRD